MARIRTIKPEFFRHEELQELEANNPGHYPMLVFSGLFTQCDKNGVFEWRPRMLALDILPFLWRGSIGEALGKTLELLRDEGFIKQLEMDGKQYGFIPSFAEHQRISGKEAQGKPKNPEPSEMIEVLQGKHRGSTGEAQGKPPESQEGKGRERKGTEYCSERLQESSEPSGIEIILNTKKPYLVPVADVEEWQALFPAVDVLGELRKMAAWAKANPTKRKTAKGINRFIVSWLSKEQDRGGSRGGSPSSPHQPPAPLTPKQQKDEDEWNRLLPPT